MDTIYTVYGDIMVTTQDPELAEEFSKSGLAVKAVSGGDLDEPRVTM